MRIFIMLFLFLSLSLAAYTDEIKMIAKDTSEQNKQLIRKLYEECINLRKLELLSEFIANDYAGPDGQTGPSAFANNVVSLQNGFPDIHFTLEDVIAEGDRVTVRWQWKGTHQGTFGTFPATQKEVLNNGIVIYQVRDNKIIRSWLQVDRLGVLQQIGVIPKELGSRPQN